jgi:hypothetical protein
VRLPSCSASCRSGGGLSERQGSRLNELKTLKIRKDRNSENIPCLHFLLNDKKELMHDNQLVSVEKYISDKNIQLVASILKDKLPDELKNEKYYVVKLSQEDKLFRIEEN